MRLVKSLIISAALVAALYQGLSALAATTAKSIATIDLPLPKLATKPSYTEKELYCVARTVYGEARGESDYGKHLVAMVIINRAISSRKQSSLCQITSAPNQFVGAGVSVSLNNEAAFRSFMRSVDISRETLDRYVYYPTEEKALLYFHSNLRDPHWVRGHAFAFQEGRHRFFKGRIVFNESWIGRVRDRCGSSGCLSQR